MQPDEIDIEESHGLDSSVAVVLIAELASVLGCELEPTLFWEYPIAELSVHSAQNVPVVPVSLSLQSQGD